MPESKKGKEREELLKQVCGECKTSPRPTLYHNKSGNPFASNLLRYGFTPTDEQLEAIDQLHEEVVEDDPYALQLTIRHYMLRILNVYDDDTRKRWVGLETTYRPELDVMANNGMYHEIIKVINLELPNKLGMSLEEVLNLPNGVYQAIVDSVVRQSSEP